MKTHSLTPEPKERLPRTLRPPARWRAGAAVLLSCVLPGALSMAAQPRAGEVDVLIVPYRQVSVSFPVGGILKEMIVREGSQVESGAPLATLEHEEQLLDALRFEKVLEKRRSDHEATAKLFAERMISEEEALEKRIEMEIAELQHRRALAEVDRRHLRAPLTGLVVSRLREPGEWVDPGTVVLEIVDIDQVYAQLMLTAEQSAAVRLGQEVSLAFPGMGRGNAFAGKVDFIDPRIDASSGLLKVRVLIENPDHKLPPGLSGFARLPQ